MTTTPIKSHRLAALIAVASLALLGACANKGINPVAELTTARASVAQAESAGALQLAPVEMLSARTKLGKAEAAAREEQFTVSRRMADEATADAELAERKARASKAQTAVDELQRANAALEKEAARKP